MSEIEVPRHPPYTIKQFAIGANASRSYIYSLPEDLHPRWAKIKGRRFIMETPLQWLERVAALDGPKKREGSHA